MDLWRGAGWTVALIRASTKAVLDSHAFARVAGATRCELVTGIGSVEAIVQETTSSRGGANKEPLYTIEATITLRDQSLVLFAAYSRDRRGHMEQLEMARSLRALDRDTKRVSEAWSRRR
jgi:hypothetical protein